MGPVPRRLDGTVPVRLLLIEVVGDLLEPARRRREREWHRREMVLLNRVRLARRRCIGVLWRVLLRVTLLLLRIPLILYRVPLVLHWIPLILLRVPLSVLWIARLRLWIPLPVLWVPQPVPRVPLLLRRRVPLSIVDVA